MVSHFTYKRFITILYSATLFVLLPITVQANEEDDDILGSLSLESLLNMTVSSASGVEESLRDAPAAMVIITADDITKRGYTGLWEIFADLPGFDVIHTGQNVQATAYQRGYRTPWTQRTLFLVNGKSDFNLWSHSANFSNQYGLQNVERVEVLYGPAGAVYGPNAFLGVVNLITKRPQDIEEDYINVSLQTGSHSTKAMDLAAGGNFGEFKATISYKTYNSDEAGLDDLAPWGFLTDEIFSNRTIWGAVLDHSARGIAYGSYANLTNEDGLIAEVNYQNFTVGFTDYDLKSGYGGYYAADHGQANDSWQNGNQQIYVEHKAKVGEQLTIKTLVSRRESSTGGGWAEAEPDWNVDQVINSPSFVSISDWNSFSTARLFKQDYEYGWSDTFRLSGGIKYEKKALNKAYEICYYWSTAFCSAPGASDSASWPTENGPGIYHSSAENIVIGPSTRDKPTAINVVDTSDKGLYVQGIWDLNNWRINAGIRYDRNNLYGSTTNPRASAVWKVTDRGTIKLLYGEAFQEPAPTQLFGGWTGRAANPDLQPEEMRNIELVLMYQSDFMLHDISLYRSEFENVIKEEAENAGTRDIWGVEYRGNFSFNHFLDDSEDISGYLNYTYTKTDSSIHYDFNAGDWVEGADEIGDIAPHKINAGLNIPVGEAFNANVRVNYVSDRELYSRNPLSDQSRPDGGREAQSYLTMDINLIYHFGPAELALKVKNLFDKSYYHPGAEAANSGDDFTRRALGYNNSLIPQDGRNWLFSLKLGF
ncbi:MAG: outer membrane receptor for ferrienterochelin and colicins [Alteromonadaceae bacterium]|jgi:outer membrane receptor for ferrienterochelin and colicins